MLWCNVQFDLPGSHMNLVCLIFLSSQQAFTYYTTNFNWAVNIQCLFSHNVCRLGLEHSLNTLRSLRRHKPDRFQLLLEISFHIPTDQTSIGLVFIHLDHTLNTLLGEFKVFSGYTVNILWWQYYDLKILNISLKFNIYSDINKYTCI